MWNMLPKRTLKAVWSQRELSVRLPQGWGKGQAQAERVRMSRTKGYLNSYAGR